MELQLSKDNYNEVLKYTFKTITQLEEKINTLTIERDNANQLLIDIQADFKEITNKNQILHNELEESKKQIASLTCKIALLQKEHSKKCEKLNPMYINDENNGDCFNTRYIQYLVNSNPSHADLKRYEQETISKRSFQSIRQDIMAFNDKFIVTCSSEYTVKPEWLYLAKTEKHYAKYLFYPNPSNIDGQYWSTEDGNSSGWAQIEFCNPKKITSYRLLSETYEKDRNILRPNKWSIEGSNNGIEWILLDSQEIAVDSKKFWLKGGATYSQWLQIDEPEYYKFYRLNVSSEHKYQCIVRRWNMLGYSL